MKFFYSYILIACLAFSLHSQTSKELSISFIQKLERQQFDSCYAMFDTIIANKISVGMLEQMWGNIPRYMGEYKGYTEISIEKKDSNEIVFVLCNFEKTKMNLQLAFDNPPQKIVGMFFTPPKSKNAYVAPEYVQQHKYYETKIPVKTGTLSLPGALCVPNNTKNPPVVILLAGSGPSDKDGSIGPNKVLKDLATGLASNGIATYRYDKRTLTYGKDIAQNPEKFTLQQEVIDDAISAIDMLKKNADFKNSKFYIAGHSLGAMCAPMIAAKSKSVSGIILLAGNARPLEDLLIEQYTYIFSLDTLDEDEKKVIDTLSTQVKIVKDAKLLKTAKANELPLGLNSVYWQSLTKYNQLETAKKIKQPILVLQGERDYQVIMTDFNLWQQNLNSNTKNKFITYPALNHLFMKGEGKCTPAEYEIQNNVEEKVITDISNWVKTQK